MLCLIILLSFIVGLLLLDKNSIYISISLIIIIVFLSLKRYRKLKFLLIITFSFVGGFLKANINFKESNCNNLIALVTKRKENYFIVQTLKEKFYCFDNKKEDVNLFDIVEINGNFSNIDFAKYEGNFDFNEYLHKQGINRIINIKEIRIKRKSLIQFENYKEKVLNKIQDEDTKYFISSLLFGEVEYGSKSYTISKKLMIINLFSISGVFINFLLYGISKLLTYFMTDKKAKILSFILLLPLFLFNFYRFIFIRTFIFFIVGIIFSNKNKEEKLSIKIITYLIFLILFKTLIYNASFYLPLLIMITHYLSTQFIYSESKFIKTCKRKLIFYLILIPLLINSYNGINIINLLFGIALLPWFKLLFLCSVIMFYGVSFKCLEYVIKLTLNILNKFDFDYLTVHIPSINSFYLILYYLFLFIFIYFSEINYKKMIKITILEFICLTVLYVAPIENSFTCEVSFINVGQGDATLIRYKNEYNLVDTGGIKNYDIANNVLIPYLVKKRIYKIDNIFITHYDYDHYGALDNLKKNFKIKKIIDYPVNPKIKT
ncbi:MAG: MBL fold metallo-hydrolase [Mollicutes bacterium]|nr:MBL fold metallo-hydrolase [Mollicutes bacterium]MDD7263395.1 MBL fold metallo-hydrolase [bacterium]MDY4978972.1 MBL fold metallo-hydrolase [Candidatus Onthovivens sp.]